MVGGLGVLAISRDRPSEVLGSDLVGIAGQTASRAFNVLFFLGLFFLEREEYCASKSHFYMLKIVQQREPTWFRVFFVFILYASYRLPSLQVR